MSERINPNEKINSLTKLREVVGLKPIKKRKEKLVMCKLCGKEMTHVAHNTWHCRNEIEGKKDKDGNPKICGNIYIRKNYK